MQKWPSPPCEDFQSKYRQQPNMIIEPTEVSLQQYIDSRVGESDTLEFKRSAPLSSDKDKHEFLKDVSALANTNGGQIIYGIAEDAGVASELCPLGPESADSLILRLAQSLRSSVEPQIPSVQFRSVDLAKGGYVLVLSVGRSFVGPHRVTLNGKNAFYARGPRGVFEYSYPQLRDAFNLRERAADRARAFRAERLVSVKMGRTPKPLLKSVRYVIHMLPLSAFATSPGIDIEEAKARHTELLFGRQISYTDYYNLDGLLISSQATQTHVYKYVQLFRSGAVETSGFAALANNEQRLLPSLHLAQEFRAAIQNHAKALISLGVSGPICVGISLLNIGDHQLALDNYHFKSCDREDLELPELWFDSILTLAQDPDAALRPALTILWQCFDEPRCYYYNDDGVWEPPRQVA
ncbi:hypothetical protein MyNCGM683_12030 [Achromobacter xylosoxidans]